jgi:hypothetical protein
LKELIDTKSLPEYDGRVKFLIELEKTVMAVNKYCGGTACIGAALLSRSFMNFDPFEFMTNYGAHFPSLLELHARKRFFLNLYCCM